MKSVSLGSLAAGALVIASLVPAAAAAPTVLKVSITSGPSDPSSSGDAIFSFTASQPRVSFTCSLDSGAPSSCSSPASYRGLGAGRHTFTVVATLGREIDRVSYGWTIAFPPALEVTITGRPADPTDSPKATLSFAASRAGASFTCSVDGSPPSACSSPMSYSGLGEGRHTFTVTAILGRETDSVSYGWTIALDRELVPPRLTPPPPPPPPKALWLKQLLPKIGGGCAVVREQKTGKIYYQKQPNRHCWTGSTAKIFTLHVALEALRKGTVALTDSIPYSQKMVDQGCTCMGNYAKDNSYDSGTGTWTYPPKEYAHLGETISLKDALRGVALSAAEPTVGVAEWVANAHFHATKATGSSKDASTNLEKEFVSLMNGHVAALGLTNTVYANEHGGWEPLPGLSSPYSSALDMVRMWDHAVADDPRFLEVMGLRDYDVTTTIKVPVYQFFHFGKGYGYYPKLEGDKNGGVTPAKSPEYSSVIAGSTRLGRRLTVDVMESGSWKGHPNAADDAGELLDYSFKQIFNPRLRGANSAKPKAIYQALDCFGKDRCITAILTPKFRLSTWKVDASSGDVKVLWSTPSAKPGGGCTGEIGTGCGASQGPSYSEVDVAHLGVPTSATGTKTSKIRIFVSAVRTAARDVTLTSWKLKTDGSVVKLATDGGAAGQGLDLKLQRLSARRFVLGARSQDGTLRYSTWQVAGNGSLTKLATTNVGAVLEYDLAPSDYRPTGFVEVRRRQAQGFQLVARSVEDDGSITTYAVGAANYGPREYLSIARLGLARYVTASAEPASVGDVRVDLWNVSGNGNIYKTASMGPYPGDVTRTDLASLAGGEGVLLAARDDSRLRLFPMEYDDKYANDGGKQDYFKVGAASWEKAQLLEVAPLQTSVAAGDYATAFVNPEGKLRIAAWRVGAKT